MKELLDFYKLPMHKFQAIKHFTNTETKYMRLGWVKKIMPPIQRWHDHRVMNDSPQVHKTLRGRLDSGHLGLGSLNHSYHKQVWNVPYMNHDLKNTGSMEGTISMLKDIFLQLAPGKTLFPCSGCYSCLS